MKIGSLSEKLILYFVLLGIGAIAVVSWVSFNSASDALMGRTFDQLTSLRLVKKSQIAQFYADRARELRFLAKNPSPTSGGSFRPGPISRYFTAYYLLDRNGILSQGCFDSSNFMVPVVPDLLWEKIRTKLKGKSVVVCDESLDEQTGNPFQLIATEISGEVAGGKFAGTILAVGISIEPINAIMLNNDPLSGLGLSGETYLVGSDFRMRSTSRFLPNSILKTAVGTQSVINALAGKSGIITINDYRNIPVLSSYCSIDVPGLNWAILPEIDIREAMVPIYETRIRILMVGAIIMVVFFGFVLFISRRIARPLIRLRDAAVSLGKGQYDIVLPSETNDEIGALTKSFNIMARQIKEKTTELQMERIGRVQSMFDGAENERQRLSRELHDGIGQSLIAIKLRLENLLYQDGKDVRNSIQDLKKYFDQVIDEVRSISNNLMPSVLEVFSIPVAFRNLFTETEDHSGLRIHFEAAGNFDDLDKKIKTYIYRLTQEALNNIVKHAGAREAWVNLTRDANQLTIIIRDNGKGFSPETAGKEGGNGIHNMRERAILLKGKIEILSAPSKGTTITLNVPIISADVENQNFPRG